ASVRLLSSSTGRSKAWMVAMEPTVEGAGMATLTGGGAEGDAGERLVAGKTIGCAKGSLYDGGSVEEGAGVVACVAALPDGSAEASPVVAAGAAGRPSAGGAVGAAPAGSASGRGGAG